MPHCKKKTLGFLTRLTRHAWEEIHFRDVAKMVLVREQAKPFSAKEGNVGSIPAADSVGSSGVDRGTRT